MKYYCNCWLCTSSKEKKAQARDKLRREILDVGAWMDEDKDYSIGTEQEYQEFVEKRNANRTTTTK